MTDTTTNTCERNVAASGNAARAAGYTELIHWFSAEYDLFLLVKPGTDLDSRFQAYCTDEHEFIRVNGWMFDGSAVTLTQGI